MTAATLRTVALTFALVAACAVPAPAGPGASPSDLPRGAFPSGEEGRLAWARACLPDTSMSLLLLPDLAYISSAPRPSPWWGVVQTETTELSFAGGGGATEHRSKDPNVPRVTATFTIRAENWEVDGRSGDARFRPAVECVYRRLAER